MSSRPAHVQMILVVKRFVQPYSLSGTVEATLQRIDARRDTNLRGLVQQAHSEVIIDFELDLQASPVGISYAFCVVQSLAKPLVELVVDVALEGGYGGRCRSLVKSVELVLDL